MRTAQRSAEIRREVLEGPAPAANTDFKEMRERLEGFEKTLLEHAGKAEEEEAPRAVQRSSSAEDLLGDTPQGAGEGGAKHKREIDDYIRKLRPRSQLPQQLVIDQLGQYQEMDEGDWHAVFPIGYRERLAAPLLSEVYQRSASGEAFAREMLRSKDATECHSGRELIATLGAIDTMLMHDRTPGLLNLTSTERLARKAYGLAKAFQPVKGKDCWSRPKGKEGGSWRSKLDWETARRFDPFLTQEPGVTLMAADEEARKEIERDASILKAKNKLEERGGSKVDLG